MVRLITKYRVDVESLAHKGVIKAQFGTEELKVSKPCASLPTGTTYTKFGALRIIKLMYSHK